MLSNRLCCSEDHNTLLFVKKKEACTFNKETVSFAFINHSNLTASNTESTNIHHNHIHFFNIWVNESHLSSLRMRDKHLDI